MKIVVDAYAWVELFTGSEKGKKEVENIEEASEAYKADTVLVEVAHKYLREGANQEAVMSRLRMITEASDIASIDAQAALEAAKCYMELSDEARRSGLKIPILFDATVLGIARLLKAKILTGDEHFRNLPETIWIG